MRRVVAWSIGGILVASGVVALSAPVWADDGASPSPAPPGRESSGALASSTSDRIAVPDVTGLTLHDASDRIEAAGLTITAVSFAHGPDSGKPAPDEVAWCQLPRGGDTVEPNTKVLVIFDDPDHLARQGQ